VCLFRISIETPSLRGGLQAKLAGRVPARLDIGAAAKDPNSFTYSKPKRGN